MQRYDINGIRSRLLMSEPVKGTTLKVLEYVLKKRDERAAQWFIAHVVDGKTQKEIAAEAQVHPSTVSHSIRLTTNKLLDAMELLQSAIDSDDDIRFRHI